MPKGHHHVLNICVFLLMPCRKLWMLQPRTHASHASMYHGNQFWFKYPRCPGTPRTRLWEKGLQQSPTLRCFLAILCHLFMEMTSWEAVFCLLSNPGSEEYPPVICYTAMEHDHRNSNLEMVIFHCNVRWLEGSWYYYQHWLLPSGKHTKRHSGNHHAIHGKTHELSTGPWLPVRKFCRLVITCKMVPPQL